MPCLGKDATGILYQLLLSVQLGVSLREQPRNSKLHSCHSAQSSRTLQGSHSPRRQHVLRHTTHGKTPSAPATQV